MCPQVTLLHCPLTNGRDGKFYVVLTIFKKPWGKWRLLDDPSSCSTHIYWVDSTVTA